MSLPTTNITTSMVSSAIGLGSNDVGALCAKAKTGGIGGWAFNIVENGGTITDGSIIDGAEPYFNKWSNNSPGEWILPNDVTKSATFRLKRSLSDNSRYAFKLGSFAGYDSDSAAPTISSYEAEYPNGSGSHSITVPLTLNLGSYNWAKLGATHVKIMIYNGSQFYSESELKLITTGDIQFGNTTVTVSTIYSGTQTWTVYAGLCLPDGTNLGMLPVSGSISISVFDVIPSSLDIYFAGNTFTKNGLAWVEGEILYQNFTVGNYAQYIPAKTLWKIVYNLISDNGGAILNTLTVTSIDSTYDKPSSVDEIDPSSGLFKIGCKYAWDRMLPSDHQHLEITMYYH